MLQEKSMHNKLRSQAPVHFNYSVVLCTNTCSYSGTPLKKDTPEIMTPLYSGHFAVTQIMNMLS